MTGGPPRAIHRGRLVAQGRTHPHRISRSALDRWRWFIARALRLRLSRTPEKKKMEAGMFPNMMLHTSPAEQISRWRRCRLNRDRARGFMSSTVISLNNSCNTFQGWSPFPFRTLLTCLGWPYRSRGTQFSRGSAPMDFDHAVLYANKLLSAHIADKMKFSVS